jgi:hypothetical protein
VKSKGSIFANMAKVITATYRMRGSTTGKPSPQSFYDPPMIGSQPHRMKLAHIDRFKLLDKAAVITDPSELNNQGKPKNGWRLCSLQQVKELKCMIGVLPVWLTRIGCFVAMTQMSSFSVLQAIQMNKSVEKFHQPGLASHL